MAWTIRKIISKHTLQSSVELANSERHCGNLHLDMFTIPPVKVISRQHQKVNGIQL
jgi:hypothetical protein